MSDKITATVTITSFIEGRDVHCSVSKETETEKEAFAFIHRTYEDIIKLTEAERADEDID